jgi:triacylglycerol lipase
VIPAAVPPSGSIEKRAEKLAETIAEKAKGKEVNIIAHSMVQSRPESAPLDQQY